MPTDTTLPADPTVETLPAPIWSRLIVGALIVAIGAATGLGAFTHLEVEPWLAWAVGAGTALALAGLDQALQRPATPSRARVGSSERRAPTVRGPSAPAASAPKATSEAPSTGSSGAGPGASASALKGPLTEETFDQHVRHLQSLVREMAQATPGPKARSADPDGLSRFDSYPPPGPARAPAAPRARAPAAPAPAGSAPTAPASTPAGLATAGTPRTAAPGGALAGAPRVAEAVAAERLDVLLESIQSLGDGRARHFEVSVRFRDATGADIGDRELLTIARRAGLAARIDALKLPRVARVARKVQQRGGQPADVLSGVAGPSLADHGFMEAFASAMTGPTPPPLVLSFSQADVRDFARIHWSALATLSEMGIRFALTDVTDVDMDMDLLRARGFTFVKLDAGVFLEGLPHATGVIPARDICRHFETAGLALIVSRIDAEAQLAAIRAHGVQFAQGALFGGARKVRADVLADAA